VPIRTNSLSDWHFRGDVHVAQGEIKLKLYVAPKFYVYSQVLLIPNSMRSCAVVDR